MLNAKQFAYLKMRMGMMVVALEGIKELKQRYSFQEPEKFITLAQLRELNEIDRRIEKLIDECYPGEPLPSCRRRAK